MATANIVLLDAARRLQGERCSKLLDPAQGLGAWLEAARTRLRSAGLEFDSRPPHIEVLRRGEVLQRSDDESAAALTQRAAPLQGPCVPLRLEAIGGAAVVPTGDVDGYGATHATLAFFARGATPGTLAACRAAMGLV
jgi:hypothetical protein